MKQKNAADRRKYYSRYIAHYTQRNIGLLLLGLLFLLGVLLGTLLLRTASGDTLDLLLRIVGSFVQNRREQTLLQNFLSSLASSLGFLAVLMVCGFCAVSQPVVVLAPLFRGLGVGLSMASLYAAHGAGAIGYVALLMLPGTLLSTVAILLCCRESLRLSASFLGAARRTQNREPYPVRIYLARYFACALLCVLAAFVEAALYFGFANLLVLG